MKNNRKAYILIVGGFCMILLRANAELQQTFEKLIHMIKVPVKWNGIFAVVDNYVILQGEVRSLFFHFDSKNVTTNIIEIPEQIQIEGVGENLRVQNALNMILYVFGKWGTIRGIRVEKNYEELNNMFTGIMQEYEVEPEYTPEDMRFYKNGIHITYEDVIQMAMEYHDENELNADTEEQGLWRKIIWKKEKMQFKSVDTTIEERRAGRLGNNFYMVGYLCPRCGKNLHMVVYPEGKTFRIETEEGGVLLARAATCASCQCFFTPRPKKLFADEDVYIMDFGEDTVAYEDYMELLGKDGARVSNCHCNEYADGRDCEEESEEESLEDLCTCLPELSEEELSKIQARIEEGFYSDESIRKVEHAIKERAKHYRGAGKIQDTETAGKAEASGEIEISEKTEKTKISEKFKEKPMHTEQSQKKNILRDGQNLSQGVFETESGVKYVGRPKQKVEENSTYQTAGRKKTDADIGVDLGENHAFDNEIILTQQERDEVRKKYDARMPLLERYSERQLSELKNQLERERRLPPEEKNAYLERVEKKLVDEQVKRLSDKTASCEGKSYVVIKRMIEEVERAPILEEAKQSLLEKLYTWKQRQAEREVSQLIAGMPKNLARKQYKQYVQRMKDYDGVDFSPYEEVLKERYESAEKQEISDIVKRARKVEREDFVALADKLHESDFLPELVLPYIKKIEERIREIDAETLAEICPNPMQMMFEEGMQAYEKIKEGDFLPELKKDALNQLTKRLAKIKTDECELLVRKLKEELEKAGIAENSRHHFYPARKVLLKQAQPEELEVIEFAMASYAAGRGIFEYPVLVVDATRNKTGKEGIILTPEHLYYSTLLNAYGVGIDTISKIEGSTGFLNKGLYMHQKNGMKTKLPYAVESRELGAFAEVLDSFVHYLQEKPDSRSLTYLASEKHETICCFRCGHEYRGGNICPKCGYQNNE